MSEGQEREKMQQKKIIVFLIVLFLAGSTWLFYISDKLLDQNKGGNWWTIYFSDPKSNSLNFVIENHSDNAEFGWKVLEKNQTKKEGVEKIEKGENKEIEIKEIFENKIIIEVKNENEKKEIYKNFDK
jgi:hypothetical protein